MYLNDGTDGTRHPGAIAAASDDGRTPVVARQVGPRVFVASRASSLGRRQRWAPMVRPLGMGQLTYEPELEQVVPEGPPRMMFPPPPRPVAPELGARVPGLGVRFPGMPRQTRPPGMVALPPGAMIGPKGPVPGAPAARGVSTLALLGAAALAAVLAFS